MVAPGWSAVRNNGIECGMHKSMMCIGNKPYNSASIHWHHHSKEHPSWHSLKSYFHIFLGTAFSRGLRDFVYIICWSSLWSELSSGKMVKHDLTWVTEEAKIKSWSVISISGRLDHLVLLLYCSIQCLILFLIIILKFLFFFYLIGDF